MCWLTLESSSDLVVKRRLPKHQASRASSFFLVEGLLGLELPDAVFEMGQPQGGRHGASHHQAAGCIGAYKQNLLELPLFVEDLHIGFQVHGCHTAAMMLSEFLFVKNLMGHLDVIPDVNQAVNIGRVEHVFVDRHVLDNIAGCLDGSRCGFGRLAITDRVVILSGEGVRNDLALVALGFGYPCFRVWLLLCSMTEILEPIPDGSHNMQMRGARNLVYWDVP